MKRLNVCLINDSFPPTIDGVANTVFNYATIINKNYGNAVVATPEYPNVKDDYPFEVLRFPSIDATKLVGYRAGIPFELNYLSKFKDRNIDIIHTHCPVSSTALARVLRDTTKKPIILTYHTKFDIDIKKAIDSKLLQETAIKALVANINAVDEVWTVSAGAGENLKSLGYKGDYIVMPNGVDFTKGKASQQQIDKIKLEYNIPDNTPLYLFVGRMMWYKGLKIIIDALKEVNNHNIDFRMMFVGGGTDFDDVNEYAKKCGIYDKCIFTGRITNREKLKAIFSTADIFLFPSSYDTNGIVVREAAASQLGTILIKGSCAAEDTIDGQNVIQIDENSDSLAKVLISAGNNMDYFHRIGKNALDQLYISWQESVDRAYNRYFEVLDKYEYKESMKITNGDLFFKMFSDVSVGVAKARASRQYVIHQGENIKNKLTDSFDNFIESTNNSLENVIESSSRSIEGLIDKANKQIDKLKKTQQLIEYRKEEIKEYVNDVMDREL